MSFQSDSNGVPEVISSLQGILKTSVSDSVLLKDALAKLDYLSASFSALVSKNIVNLVHETCEERERKRIIILDGLPESKHELGHQRNLEDLELVRSISDNLGLDNSIWATERLGRRSTGRSRLLKIFFLSSQASSLFIRGFSHLRASNPTFSKIYARYSMSESERKREFELRQEARKRSETEGVRYVVYAGVLTKKDDVEALKVKLRNQKASETVEAAAIKPQRVSHHSRSFSRTSNRGQKRSNSQHPNYGTRAKQQSVCEDALSVSSIQAALSQKSNTDWQNFQSPNVSSLPSN